MLRFWSMAEVPVFITMHEVAKRKMIPWAESRVTVTKLFHTKKIRNIKVQQGKGVVYLTTPTWVKAYIRKELKGKI